MGSQALRVSQWLRDLLNCEADSIFLPIPYRWYILRGKIFANFAFKKNYTQKTKFYMVHTLFLTDSRKFNPAKYTTYTVVTCKINN